ncbi:hypothetical protein [Mycolicibacterium llatzerense]|uniref:hypothetical protein n=1 Tax=Mycolicibacterium llatzerense TaxID=280871 RepID=UPI0008DE5271|nr:hypothetical protein [Mycolicibacterium llatzerense]
MQHNETNTARQWEADGPLDPNQWVPAYAMAVLGFGRSLYAADTIESRVRYLTTEFADRVLFDDVGTPHLPRPLCRLMHTERVEAERDHQAREQARAAELAARGNETRDFVLALQRQQQHCHLDPGAPLSAQALGQMMASDPGANARADAKAAMAFGQSSGGSYGPEGKQ